MSRRSNSPGRLRRRAAGERAQRLLWVVAALGGISLLGFGTAEGLQQLSLPKVATFFGHLRDNARPMAIVLPPGIAVDRFLVRGGARITKGQTLAQLEPVSIATAIRRVSDRLEINQQILTCLLAASPGSAFRPIDADMSGLNGKPADPGPVAASADASPACAPTVGPHEVALRALDADDTILVARGALIDRRIKLETAQVPGPGKGRDASVKLVLGLAWEQSRVELAHAANQFRRAGIARDKARVQEDRIRKIREETQRTQTELDMLTQLQQDPRLTSPVNATLLEAHQTPPGGVFDAPVPLMRIIPDDPDRFDIQLAVQADATPVFKEGAVLSVELVGSAMPWPQLSGHVAGLEQPQDGSDIDTLLVRVVLDPQSAATFADMSARSGFISDGSAVAVQAVLPAQPLAAAMVMALTDAALARTMPAP